DDPLYRYGLDSLAAIEIAHAIETYLGVSVSMADFLADKSVSVLSAEIADRRGSIATVTSKPHRESEYPLSRGQQAIWFIHQMDPQSDAYNIAGAFRITSDLEVERLRHAFQLLVDRHQSLQTTFTEAGGIVRQRVNEKTAVAFVVQDAAEWSDELLSSR